MKVRRKAPKTRVKKIRLKSYDPGPEKLRKWDKLQVNGLVIERGDLVLVKGEGKERFMFHAYVENHRSGKNWIDVYSLSSSGRHATGELRSFRTYKIRTLK